MTLGRCALSIFCSRGTPASDERKSVKTTNPKFIATSPPTSRLLPDTRRWTRRTTPLGALSVSLLVEVPFGFRNFSVLRASEAQAKVCPPARSRQDCSRPGETTGYEPFALHDPMQWAMLGVCDCRRGGDRMSSLQLLDSAPPQVRPWAVIQKGFTRGTLSNVNSSTEPDPLSCQEQFAVLK